jgi:hypothetical protein
MISSYDGINFLEKGVCYTMIGRSATSKTNTYKCHFLGFAWISLFRATCL